MQKILLLLAFLVVSMGVEAQTSAIKTNIVDLGYKDVIVQYEKVIDDKSTFQVGLSPYIGVSGYDGSVFGANFEYRMYFTKKEALRGFYLMTGLGSQFGNLVSQETNEEFKGSAISVNANLGYQWIWNNGIVLDLALGARYFIGLGDIIAPEYDGMKPSVNIGLGYAF